MKKLKCIIMVLLLMASNFVAITASNDLWTYDETGYSSLEDAVGSTSGDRTFVLNDDRNMAYEVISLYDSEITIDLNGFDYVMDTIYSEGANIKIVNSGADMSVFTIDSIIINSGTVEIGANIFVIIRNSININNTEHDRKLIIGKDSKLACVNSGWDGIHASNLTQSNAEIVIDGELNRSSCNVSVTGNIKLAIGDNAIIENNRIEFGATVYNQLDNASDYYYDIEVSDYDLLSDLNLKVYRGSYNFNPDEFIDNDLYKIIYSDNTYKVVSKYDYTCQAAYGEEGLEISFYGEDAENAADLLVKGQIDNTYSDSTYETENRNSYLSLNLMKASFDGYGNIKNYKRYYNDELQEEMSYIKKKDNTTVNISVEDLRSMGYIDGEYNITVCVDEVYNHLTCEINTGIGSDSVILPDFPEIMDIVSKKDLKIYQFQNPDIVADDFVVKTDADSIEITDIGWYYKEENGHFQYANVFYSDEFYYIGIDFKCLDGDINKLDLSKYTFNGNECEQIVKFGGVDYNNKIEYGTTYNAIFPLGEVSEVAEVTCDDDGLTIRFACENAEKIVDDLLKGETYSYPAEDDSDFQNNGTLRLSLMNSDYSGFAEISNFKRYEYGELVEEVNRIEKVDDVTIRINKQNINQCKLIDGSYLFEVSTQDEFITFEGEIINGITLEDYNIKEKPHRVQITIPDDFVFYVGDSTYDAKPDIKVVDDNGYDVNINSDIYWATKDAYGNYVREYGFYNDNEYYLIVGINGLSKDYDYSLEASYDGKIYYEHECIEHPFNGRSVATYENSYTIALYMGYPKYYFDVKYDVSEGLLIDLNCDEAEKKAEEMIAGYYFNAITGEMGGESSPMMFVYLINNETSGNVFIQNRRDHLGSIYESIDIFFEEVPGNKKAVKISNDKLLEMGFVNGEYMLDLIIDGEVYTNFCEINIGRDVKDLQIPLRPDSIIVSVKNIGLYEGMYSEDIKPYIDVFDDKGNRISDYTCSVKQKSDGQYYPGMIEDGVEYYLEISVPFLNIEYDSDFKFMVDNAQLPYEETEVMERTGVLNLRKNITAYYPIGKAEPYPLEVIFDEKEGLIFKFDTYDADKIVDAFVKGNSITEDIYQYNCVYLSYNGYYHGRGLLLNGEGRDESGTVVYAPFKKLDDKSVIVPISELQKYGFVDGEYEIILENANNVNTNLRIKEKCNIKTGISVSTSELINELHITIDDKYLKPCVGDELEENGAIPFKAVDENGKEVENCFVNWVKQSSYNYYSYWVDEEPFVYADKDIIGLDDGDFIWKDTPYFDSENTYYLNVEYIVPMADYGRKIKLFINGKEYEVNGKYAIAENKVDDYERLCVFEIFNTSENCSIIDFGHAAVKYNKPSEVSSKTVTDKINEIFTVSEESDGAIAYVDDANTSSSNETILNVLGDNGRIEITLRNATVENVNQDDEVIPLMTKMSFDVTPVNSQGTKLHGDIGDKVTFRLPVDGASNFAYASVYHEGTYVGTYEIQSDENGNKYIEVESDSFSVFDVYYAYEAKKIIMGDVNTDGELSGKDRILLRNYLVKKIKSDSINLSAADVNLDSKVDSLDRVYLRNLITGKIKQ